jgi:predicted alpha/beta superfamily hydrolase
MDIQAEPEIVEVPVEVEAMGTVEVAAEAGEVAESRPINPFMPVEFDSIASSTTGREYTLTIVLPMSYMMTDSDYPVVYVTDGDLYAIPLAYAAGQLAFGQEVPELIVVGVDYGVPDPMEWLELRDLDMGPEGSEQFLQFFEEELIPHVESTYRADPAGRTLAGHSSGGDFALYTLLHGTDSFSNIIASSPGSAAEMTGQVEGFSEYPGDATVRLYLSAGELDAETAANVAAFDDSLVQMNFEGLVHKMAILDNETHLSARPHAFNNGIRWLFSGEEPDALSSRTPQEVFDSHQDAIETLDVEMLMADYAENAVLITPQRVIEGKDAILTDFFNASLEQYPDMEFTYDKVVCEEDTCLVLWSGEASAASIPLGVGVLYADDGHIQREVEWFEIAPNEESGGAEVDHHWRGLRCPRSRQVDLPC